MPRSVDIIGGGPGGLYAARLLKLREPSLQVTVYERMYGAAESFGFGYGLTESTMTSLTAADPETAEQIRTASFDGHDLRLKSDELAVTLHSPRNLAIGRVALLDILATAATDVGVQLRHGISTDVAMMDADIVIAADGVGSKTREKFAAEFGVHTSLGRTRFVWCGADFAVDSAFFASVERDEALYVAHAYPYAPDRSTVLIEVDDRTWTHTDLEDNDRATPPGETDQRSITLLQDIFAEHLHSRQLLSNRTRWSRFTNLTVDRWNVENVVLLGDAAHTAHYTLGSGTKLAMEDAIAITEAICGEGSVMAALTSYEQTRRSPVERFQQLARRSQAWWESYRLRAHWSTERIALSYMTRSGNLTLAHYAADQPAIVRRALAAVGDNVPTDARELIDWTLNQPLREATLKLPHYAVSADVLSEVASAQQFVWEQADVWDETADDVIAQLAAAPAHPILVTGMNSPDLISARVDFAERLRLQSECCVGVVLPESERAQAASVIAAGRADFIVWS